MSPSSRRSVPKSRPIQKLRSLRLSTRRPFLGKAKGPDFSEPQLPAMVQFNYRARSLPQSKGTPFRSLLFIPFLAIAESQTHAEDHKTDRRHQQHNHATTDGTLAFFCSTGGVAVAHGATLAEGRTHPQQQEQPECGQAQLHLTPR